MTIHSQEDLHLGNHLVRYLPFSTNASQCAGSVCVLVSEKLSPLVSLARPPTFSNRPSSKRHVVTHYLPHFVSCLPLPTLGVWVGSTPPTLFQGSSALTQAMGPALAFPHGLWKYVYFKNIVLFICVGLPYECIYSQYSWNIWRKIRSHNEARCTTIQEAFPPWWDLPPWLNSGGRRTGVVCLSLVGRPMNAAEAIVWRCGSVLVVSEVLSQNGYGKR